MSKKTRFLLWFKAWINGKVIQGWLDRGLRAKLGLMVTVGVTGLILIFAFLGINTARQATRQALNERVLLARVSADKLDFILKDLTESLYVAASHSVIYQPSSSPEELRSTLEGTPAFGQNLLLIDAPSGTVIAGTSEVDQLNWSEIASFRRAQSPGQREPSIALVPGDHPRALLTIPSITVGNSSTVVLAVLIDLTDPVISPYSGAFELGETGTLEVVDSNGMILLSTKPDRVFQTYENEQITQQIFKEGAPSVETCLGCSQELTGDLSDEVIAFATLKLAPWGVLIQQKASEVFAPVRTLSLLTLGLGIITIIGALVLVWVTTNSVITPIQALTSAIQRIGGGDLETPIEPWGKNPILPRSRGDEVGQLAESFSVMRDRLKDLIGEIRRFNQELDQRVNERTEAALAAQMEAQAARDDLHAIIDALDDSLVVIDVHDQRILQMNRASQRFCGEPREWFGEKCFEILPSEQSCGYPHEECPITKVLATHGSIKVTQRNHCQLTGETRYFDVVASPMFDASGKITRIVELRRDVTEERQVREDLLRRNQQLAIINAVASTVNQSLDLEDILKKSLDQLIHLTSIDAGAVFLKEDPASELKMMAYQGFSKETASLAAEVGLLDGSCGGVLESGQITIVPDLTNYRGHRARSLQLEKLQTLVHIPLMVKGCTLGSMCVGTHLKQDFDMEDQQLLSALGNQIAVAIENARLYAEVQHKEKVRGELFIKAINAQEEERKRIARELHDETSQSLAALIFAIEETLDMHSLKEIKNRLTSMLNLNKRVLDEVHKIIFDLRPSMLDHLGLVPALRWLAESRLEARGVRVVVDEITPPRRLPPEVETVIFRVVQEAITNIGRHAAARNVCILFKTTDDEVTVSVDDDGVGFDLDSFEYEADDVRGLGLISMRERLELLGGELEVNSSPGEGTQIVIKLGLEGVAQ